MTKKFMATGAITGACSIKHKIFKNIFKSQTIYITKKMLIQYHFLNNAGYVKTKMRNLKVNISLGRLALFNVSAFGN